MNFEVLEVIDVSEFPTDNGPLCGWKLRVLCDGNPQVIRISSKPDRKYQAGDTFTGSITGKAKDGLDKVKRDQKQQGNRSQPQNGGARATQGSFTAVSHSAGTKGPIPYEKAYSAFKRFEEDFPTEPTHASSLFIAWLRGDIGDPPPHRFATDRATRAIDPPLPDLREPGDDEPETAITHETLTEVMSLFGQISRKQKGLAAEITTGIYPEWDGVLNHISESIGKKVLKALKGVA